MIISVKKELTNKYKFADDEYLIDLHRSFEGYQQGDLIIEGLIFDCSGTFPLSLELGIRKDGSIAFRKWRFNSDANGYFHTREKRETFVATQEQIDTVNGLWSGRITFEGLKICIGKTVQDICPIDVKKEETLTGTKIFLA